MGFSVENYWSHGGLSDLVQHISQEIMTMMRDADLAKDDLEGGAYGIVRWW